MCILLNVKKHEKTFALNVDIFKWGFTREICLTTKDPGNIIYKSVIVCKCEPKAPASI